MGMGNNNIIPEYVPYTERLADAEKKVDAFFTARFPDLEEYSSIHTVRITVLQALSHLKYQVTS